MLLLNNLFMYVYVFYMFYGILTAKFKYARWARAQCRKKRLDPYYIEDIKKMFRKPSEDEESIGLLKYVRFPVFTEDEFSCISQSSDLIMPKKIEELVHRYHVSEQPTGIFSEKRRPVTVDPGNDDFIKHIDQLISNLPAFTSSPTATCEDNSYLPSLQDDPIPMTSQSMNENQLNVITIKQEVDTDAQSCISSIPDHISGMILKSVHEVYKIFHLCICLQS